MPLAALRPRGRAAALLTVSVLALTGCGAEADPDPASSPAPAVAPSVASAAATPSAGARPTLPRVSAPPKAKINKPPTTAPVADPALRKELLAMLVEDQAVRTGKAPPGDDRTAEELSAAWDATDRRHGARMSEVLDEHGWPGWRLVGSDGAFAAWVLIQHADLDLPLQERGLALMGTAVQAGDADPSDYAYLVDRVRVAKNQPQVYGTQWNPDATGGPVPRTPIEDEAMVDVRRAEVGLGTLEEYLKELQSFTEE